MRHTYPEPTHSAVSEADHSSQQMHFCSQGRASGPVERKRSPVSAVSPVSPVRCATYGNVPVEDTYPVYMHRMSSIM